MREWLVNLLFNWGGRFNGCIVTTSLAGRAKSSTTTKFNIRRYLNLKKKNWKNESTLCNMDLRNKFHRYLLMSRLWHFWFGLKHARTKDISNNVLNCLLYLFKDVISRSTFKGDECICVLEGLLPNCSENAHSAHCLLLLPREKKNLFLQMRFTATHLFLLIQVPSTIKNATNKATILIEFATHGNSSHSFQFCLQGNVGFCISCNVGHSIKW